MAGNTFAAQIATLPAVTNDYTEQASQLSVLASATLSFNEQAAQISVLSGVWLAYNIQAPQVAVLVAVITCDSSSYVPPAPSGLITLTATPGDIGEQWVDLSWNALLDFTYTLERGTAPGVYDTALLTDSSALTFHDDTVDFNVQYFYLLTGSNVCGDQTTSNEASASPGCELPAAPLALHATANNQTNAIDLIWNPVSGTVTYSIYRGLAQGAEDTLIASGVTGNTYSDGTADGGVLYWYSVSAVNDCGVMSGSEASAQLSCCTRWTGDSGCGGTVWTADTPAVTVWTPGADCETTWTVDEC